MSAPHHAEARETAELIENVGLVADRLIANLRAGDPRGDDDVRTVLERALLVAAEAQQRLAAQSARIASLEALSVTDELTGLYNRRGFNTQLARMLALARRHGGGGLLAFIDLDDFKAINDGLGHPAGDAVLCRVADILRRNVRDTDVVARLGGDEFAAVLVHTSRAGGTRRALALGRLLNGTVVPHGRVEILVRASIGLADYGPGDEAPALIAAADAEMYRAKRAKPRVLYPWRERAG